MKILLDTNILFSAFISDGNERYLIERLIISRHTIVLTDLILEEIDYVISRKVTKSGNKKRALLLLNQIQQSRFVYTKTRNKYQPLLKEASQFINKKDALILAAGLQKEIDVIVSGDNGFIKNSKLDFLRGQKIFTAKELLRIL